MAEMFRPRDGRESGPQKKCNAYRDRGMSAGTGYVSRSTLVTRGRKICEVSNDTPISDAEGNILGHHGCNATEFTDGYVSATDETTGQYGSIYLTGIPYRKA